MKRIITRALAFVIALAMMMTIPVYSNAAHAKEEKKTKTITNKSDKEWPEVVVKKGDYSKITIKNKSKKCKGFIVTLEKGTNVDEIVVSKALKENDIFTYIVLQDDVHIDKAVVKSMTQFSYDSYCRKHNGNVDTVDDMRTKNMVSVYVNAGTINLNKNDTKLYFSGIMDNPPVYCSVNTINCHGKGCFLSFPWYCNVKKIVYDYEHTYISYSTKDKVKVKKEKYTGIGDKKEEEEKAKKQQKLIAESRVLFELNIPFADAAEYTSTGKEYTNMIDLLDDCDKKDADIMFWDSEKDSEYAVNGISLGMSLEDVKKAYENVDEDNINQIKFDNYNYLSYYLHFKNGFYKIEFQIDITEDKVTRIEFIKWCDRIA